MYKTLVLFITTYFIAAGAEIKFPLKLQINDSNPNPKSDPIKYRLPDTAIPTKYNIILQPYFDDASEKSFTFDGNVEIKINILTDLRCITLHAKELKFTKKDVQLNCNELPYTNFDIKFDRSRDFVHINSTELIGTGSCTLKIVYSGILNNEMRGFYRSSYQNKDNQKVWLAATHFEPIGARRAFPCFDEPQYKAWFILKIKHEKSYTAISNMRSHVEFENYAATTYFEQTPKMSTYLLAFVVSDFANLTNSMKNFTIFAKPTAIENGKLALTVGEKLLKALRLFTNITLKIDKMDQAAIPDFAAGAMENWGLVLYKEQSLLFNEKTSTTSEKQNIIETIAHEFAHQWFGDLVTPKWWKYLWLNEGFANFFQSYITDKIEPEWKSVHQSVVKAIQGAAFEFDSSAKTHPLNQEVESPEEINAIFDSISYQKGGGVIRMMQHFLTEPVFQYGLEKYLKSQSESSAESDDLFKALNEAAKTYSINLDYDVKVIMDGWVNSKGYPVLKVTRNYTDKSIQIQQERFFAYNASAEEKNEKYIWYIPINYATAAKIDFKETTPTDWLKDASMKLSVYVDQDDWVIFNKQQTGFYRVNYDEQNWKLIIDYLNSNKRETIHVLNRAQLVNDALAFVQQEQLNVKILLYLTSYLKNETDYIAWYPAFKAISWLNQKLTNTMHYSIFKNYILGIMEHSIQSIGLTEQKDDEYLTKLHRVTIYKWSCLLGNKKCKTTSYEKLVAWLADSEKNPISPDLKEVVLCNGIRTANFNTWTKTLKKYELSKDTNEKSQLIKALGCSEDKEILQYYLNYTTADDSTLNDSVAAIKSIRENSIIGVDIVLDFVIKRFITLFLKVKNENAMRSLFEGLGSGITTDSQLEKLKSTEHMDIPLRITNPGIKLAEKNLEWLKNTHHILHSWEKEITSKPSSSGANSMKFFSGIFSLTSLVFLTFSVI